MTCAPKKTTKGWVARDKDGNIWIYFDEKPTKGDDAWLSDGWQFWQLDKDEFPLVRWEDEEPTEIFITIRL